MALSPRFRRPRTAHRQFVQVARRESTKVRTTSAARRFCTSVMAEHPAVDFQCERIASSSVVKRRTVSSNTASWLSTASAAVVHRFDDENGQNQQQRRKQHLPTQRDSAKNFM